MGMETKEWVPVREVMRVMQVSDQTVRRWCKLGKVPAKKIGHEWRIDKESLDKPTNENARADKT